MLTYKQEDEPSASEDAEESANETKPPPSDDTVVSTSEAPAPPVQPPPSSLETDDLLVKSANLIEFVVVYLELEVYSFWIFSLSLLVFLVVSGAQYTNWLCISNRGKQCFGFSNSTIW